MANRTETPVINSAGAVQGIVLVTFPAASIIFTRKSEPPFVLAGAFVGIAALPKDQAELATVPINAQPAGV